MGIVAEGGGGPRKIDINICAEQLCPARYSLPGSYFDGSSAPGQSRMNLRKACRSSACAGCLMSGVEEVVRRSGSDEVTIGLVHDKGDVMFASKLGKVFQQRRGIYTTSLSMSGASRLS